MRNEAYLIVQATLEARLGRRDASPTVDFLLEDRCRGDLERSQLATATGVAASSVQLRLDGIDGLDPFLDGWDS